MALTATIHRIELEISDIDRSVYHSESLRVAQHPSEEPERLVARVLAYALFWHERLLFARDLADAEEPSLWRHDDQGVLATWVEVGSPTGKRLHRAAKVADEVVVVVYKGPDDGRTGLCRAVAGMKIHRADAIIVLALPAAVVAEVANKLVRSSSWTIIRAGDSLQIIVDDAVYAGTVRVSTLAETIAAG